MGLVCLINVISLGFLQWLAYSFINDYKFRPLMIPFHQQAVAPKPRMNKLIAKCHRVGESKILRTLISIIAHLCRFGEVCNKGYELKRTHYRSKQPNNTYKLLSAPVQLFSCIASFANSKHSNRNAISVSSKTFDFHFVLCMVETWALVRSPWTP